jgi:fatty-acid desaturase
VQYAGKTNSGNINSMNLLNLNLSSFHHRLLILVYSLHVLAIAGLIYYWDPIYLLWTVLGKILFYSIGVEIGLHRYLAHRSFSMSKWKERIIVWLSIYGCYGSSLSWCANHRVHHKNADKDNDPHPSQDWFNTWFWIDTEKNAMISPTVVKDLLKDPFHRWMRNYYFHIWITTLIVSAVLISPKFTLYMFIIPGALAQLSGGMINIICHKWGYRTHPDVDDLSRNNFWANMYSQFSGVGLHNNHHAKPWSYTTLPENPKWHEIDLGAVLIRNFLMDKEGEDWDKKKVKA